MQAERLERVAQWTPFFIVAYFSLHFIIRIAASGNLETDEAQFVGFTYLALGYGNSHPPLYNWLVAGALQLTGGHWPSALALVKTAFLIGTYGLAFDTLRRITGEALPGLILVVSFLFVPQIVWKSQITLAHSVMVMFGVVATLHAVAMITERQTLGRFAWLGLAITIGAMAKYNFALMLVAIIAAALSIREMRDRFLDRRLSLSFGIAVLSLAPHAVWALGHVSGTTGRMEKLERTNELFGVLDVPGIGIDGFLSTLLGLITWSGLLVLVWFFTLYVRGSGGNRAAPRSENAIYMQFFGRTVLIGFALFCLIILAGDFTAVHERYLTPILVALPFWLALRFPLEHRGAASIHFLGTGAVIAGLMLTAWPAWIAFGKEQLAYPYDAMAEDMKRFDSRDAVLIADRDKHAANLAIRLEFAEPWRYGGQPGHVIVIWGSNADKPPGWLLERLGAEYASSGQLIGMSYGYNNLSGHEATLKAQPYTRSSRSAGMVHYSIASLSTKLFCLPGHRFAPCVNQ